MSMPMGQLPGTSKLAKDYFDNYETVAEFYGGDYRDPRNFTAKSDVVKSRELPLAKLVPILKEQNQRFGCGIQTLDNIDLLLERGACAVVTGQQTGLFGGPLFTFYKALTAIKLAQRLSRNCEGCYVPIFWLASDDHDFREANNINIIDKSNQVRKISYDGHPLDLKVPTYAISLQEKISDTIQELNDATHPSEFKEEVLARLADAYKTEATFSEAFATWLTFLCKSFGLIFIDGGDERLKRLGSHIFEQEIIEKSPSTKEVLQTSIKLRERNYHNQVQLQDGFLNLFYVEKQRNSIQNSDDRFVIRGTDKSFEEEMFLAELQTHPERFSPNVLLRPLYQDALLPTVAYVPGPGELAYYAQMKGIYEAFEMPMPILFPRKSLTLLESKIEKVVDNFQLNVSDFWGNADQLINNIAKSQMPESLEKRIENASLCVKKNLQSLQDVVTEFEPTLNNTVENVRGKILNQMEGLEKKILQAYKKRNEVIGQQIYKANNSLYPNNHLQERELNIVPYLFKHGFGFIDRLYEAIDIANFDHQIVKI